MLHAHRQLIQLIPGLRQTDSAVLRVAERDMCGNQIQLTDKTAPIRDAKDELGHVGKHALKVTHREKLCNPSQ